MLLFKTIFIFGLLYIRMFLSVNEVWDKHIDEILLKKIRSILFKPVL